MQDYGETVSPPPPGIVWNGQGSGQAAAVIEPEVKNARLAAGAMTVHKVSSYAYHLANT